MNETNKKKEMIKSEKSAEDIVNEINGDKTSKNVKIDRLKLYHEDSRNSFSLTLSLCSMIIAVLGLIVSCIIQNQGEWELWGRIILIVLFAAFALIILCRLKKVNNDTVVFREAIDDILKSTDETEE